MTRARRPRAAPEPERLTPGRKPAPDLADVEPVRLTVYLRPDQLSWLRHEVLRRLDEGAAADISMLLREGVELLRRGRRR